MQRDLYSQIIYVVCHSFNIRQICFSRQSLNQFTQFASDWNSWTFMVLASMNLCRNWVFTSSHTYCSMKRSDQDTSKVSPDSAYFLIYPVWISKTLIKINMRNHRRYSFVSSAWLLEMIAIFETYLCHFGPSWH